MILLVAVQRTLHPRRERVVREEVWQAEERYHHIKWESVNWAWDTPGTATTTITYGTNTAATGGTWIRIAE